MPNNNDETFPDLLAKLANYNKLDLAESTIRAFKDGDPTAMKLVMQSMLDSQYKEVDQLVISDERFNEICCLIADNLRTLQP